MLYLQQESRTVPSASWHRSEASKIPFIEEFYNSLVLYVECIWAQLPRSLSFGSRPYQDPKSEMSCGIWHWGKKIVKSKFVLQKENKFILKCFLRFGARKKYSMNRKTNQKLVCIENALKIEFELDFFLSKLSSNRKFTRLMKFYS